MSRTGPLRQIGFIGMCCMLLARCHSSAAQRAVSPLIGTWQINGTLPQPDANMPRFTQFIFHRDGTLNASYVAAGGLLAGVVKSSSQVRQEQDTYTLAGTHHIRIIEGSRSLEYHYDVRDGKLFLTTPGSESATVYSRIHPSDDDSQQDQPDSKQDGQ